MRFGLFPGETNTMSATGNMSATSTASRMNGHQIIHPFVTCQQAFMRLLRAHLAVIGRRTPGAAELAPEQRLRRRF
jgi:hypothetical protein